MFKRFLKVGARLRDGVYKDAASFASDVLLTFSNAMLYSPDFDDVHKVRGMTTTARRFINLTRPGLTVLNPKPFNANAS